ncbi:hypothetical protein OSH39_24640 [Mycobacterium ulcerans]|nr:hypothetical protein [Mycobacterium ulcerans]MEB3907174.1 hypothetical protein [Mycobacterium ulcerans]MEB3911311.1 hypothetical protein [Mycobacterium ulcerans]MEB3921548.1 hypothetical protein [Mycobacterium ulcerans]MEB3925682.1 hypothetical protein [Mycobacterium ulcerans]MEB3929809.1 hypothetical protein [Mycobacterium ulcerans]
MGWLQRVRRASVGQRVTRADKAAAHNAAAELSALTTERERLLREGLEGVATIVSIRRNVANTTLGSWHELELDVTLPQQDPYRAIRRIALELSSAPHLRVGLDLPVRVDPTDHSKVLIVAPL